MELDLKIAAIIICIITNFAAIFFIKSRSSSIIVISLSIFFFIGLISLILTNNLSFLKISFALVVFLITANYLFLEDLGGIDISKKTGSGKILLLILPLIFASLFGALLYLGNPVVTTSNGSVVSSSYSDKLSKDRSNILSDRSVKAKKIKKLTKDNVLIGNISLLILLATFFPLILLVQNTKPNNIAQ